MMKFVSSMFFLVLFFALPVHSMNFNSQDVFGQTALHMVAMVPHQILPLFPETQYPKIKEQLQQKWSDPKNADKQNALWAALFIKGGADVYIQDKWNKTALDYIEENKIQLPETYKVMMAGKDIADVEKQFPKKIAECKTQEDVMAILTVIGKKENFTQWCKAATLLYAKNL